MLLEWAEFNFLTNTLTDCTPSTKLNTGFTTASDAYEDVEDDDLEESEAEQEHGATNLGIEVGNQP